jgi:hypothetical protein
MQLAVRAACLHRVCRSAVALADPPTCALAAVHAAHLLGARALKQAGTSRLASCVQCTVPFVLYQSACGGKSCFGYKGARRLLAGRTYGEIAADYSAPTNWIALDLVVRFRRPMSLCLIVCIPQGIACMRHVPRARASRHCVLERQSLGAADHVVRPADVPRAVSRDRHLSRAGERWQSRWRHPVWSGHPDCEWRCWNRALDACTVDAPPCLISPQSAPCSASAR